MNNMNFSLIIPTHTGEAHLESCLNSVLTQESLEELNFDVIVVIDGPNARLEEIANQQRTKFKSRNINFKIFKFPHNKGRFDARLKGAIESKKSYILFLDDRNILAKNYFKEVIRANKTALIPNVLENDHPHFIARTIYLLRKKVYGNKWGRDFLSYEITSKNFEKSSKGTTSFWVKRDIFINACNVVSDKHSDLKAINEDTRIMREIVEHHTPIFRSSEAKIYYQPRQTVWGEIKHIYHRGPRFIDYYLKPGTRFFVPLLLVMTSPFIALALLFLVSQLFLLWAFAVAICTNFISAFAIADKRKDVLQVAIGLPLLFLCFYFGLLAGFVKLFYKKY